MKRIKSLCDSDSQKTNFSDKRFFFNFHKKAICFFACAVFFISANVFSLGAGVQFGIGPAFYDLCNSDKSQNATAEFFGNAAGTIKFFRLPLVLGFGIEASSLKDNFALGFSGFADFHLINFQIKNNLNFYSGTGISGGLLFSLSNKKQVSGSGGLRIFCGAEIILFDNFTEIYAQLTGNPIMTANRNVNSESNIAFCVKTPIEFGIRFHF